jgi:hypothetical protein
MEFSEKLNVLAPLFPREYRRLDWPESQFGRCRDKESFSLAGNRTADPILRCRTKLFAVKKQVHSNLYGNEFTLTLGMRATEVGPEGFPQDMSLLYLFMIAAVLVIDSWNCPLTKGYDYQYEPSCRNEGHLLSFWSDNYMDIILASKT